MEEPINTLEQTLTSITSVPISALAEQLNNNNNNDEYPNAPDTSELSESYDPITQNPKSSLLDFGTSRFSGAVWYNKIQEKNIILAGLGGIGRFGNLINF